MDRTIRCLAALSLLPALAQAADSAGPVLQTWHPWQLDSVLVAWALVQKGHPAAAFESVPRGTAIEPTRAIDTPDSLYRRTAQRTAFEEAVRHQGVVHACVARLRDAVRVVELAPWRKPEFVAVEAFEARVLQQIPAQPMRGGIEPALAQVDRYCKEAQ
jgi:hypothetical protein